MKPRADHAVETLSAARPARVVDAVEAGNGDFLRNFRHQAQRLRHLATAALAMPAAIDRLRWPAERLQQEREAKLRTLLAHAKAHSPWHAQRLAGIDPARIGEAEMARLPVMTKDDLMENFDAIVTDRRLTLAMIDDHLAHLIEDRYLLDGYHAVASGGSSGRRGVFVYDWEAWTQCFVGMQRYAVTHMGCAPSVRRRITVGQVAAGKATHLTNAIGQSFANPLLKIRRFPVTLPLAQIVAGLNALRPMVLQGYPSMLQALAHEAEEGRLRIAPQVILSIAEPLFPETRAALDRAFGAPVHNWWGTSEGGGMGMSCGAGPWLHLSDDALIIELVDAAGRPVAPGETAAKLYVTNLFNRLLPLVRYEISDTVTLMAGPCPCGSSHRRVEDVQGRHDDAFVYGPGIVAHPHLFRTALANHPDVVDYQVRQTRDGAEINVIEARPFDQRALAATLASGLASIGVAKPVVTVVPRAGLERHVSGKLARFVALRRGAG